MDRILIKDLFTRCLIGVNAEERRDKQDIIINIILWVDLRQAGASDSLEDTIDYSALKKAIVAMADQSAYYLVEALAERIAVLCLADPRVRRAQVTVEKPTALRFARSVGVEITRNNRLPENFQS